MSEFSEDSFDDSASPSYGSDEPPTLDETLFDLRLFLTFGNYLKSQHTTTVKLEANLQFLKQARLFRLLRMPREVILQQAVKMIWSFFSECAPLPVLVPAETKKKLMEMALDPDAELGINKDMFSVAFEEVYNVIVPHFRNWISTKEWRDAVPFHRLPPPTFSIVLSSTALRFLFNKYLKAQVEHGGDENSTRVYHMWKFCLMANDFREGKCTHLSHLEPKKKSKGDDSASVTEEKEKPAEEEDKPIEPEEYAKQLYKKYKRHISLMYDGSIPHAVFIVRALDRLIEEFDRSEVFQRWIALKQYHGVDFQAKVVHQTLTADGFVEPPTLAAAMTSGMLPFFLVLTAGSEAGANLEFLADVLKFRRDYSTGNSDSGSSGSSSGSQKDMVEEARRIFTKYLDSELMYCDPDLVEEVRAIVTKKGGKGVNSRIFRKCGAFIYQRSEHTWCREARATLAWANKSYNNTCRAARDVEEEFSIGLLPEGIDLHIVPTTDDVFYNNVLLDDFKKSWKEQIAPIEKFRDLYLEYFTLAVNQRKKHVEKIMNVLGEIATYIPDLQPIQKVLVKETSKRERVSDSVIIFCLYMVGRAGFKVFYPKWIVERASFWRKAEWKPVKTVMFSDMASIVGAAAIDKKIRDEALKGKTGIARLVVMRQLRKQQSTTGGIQVKAIRGTGSGSSHTVFTTAKATDLINEEDAKKFRESSPGPRSKIDLVIPSIIDTLSSSYLRRYFDNTFLCGFISSAEHQLWEALHQFFEKYSTMDSKKLLESQDEMRKTIAGICEKFKHLLKNVDELKQRGEKEKVIFPQFFRDAELELYTEAHTRFEKVLANNGWK